MAIEFDEFVIKTRRKDCIDDVDSMYESQFVSYIIFVERWKLVSMLIKSEYFKVSPIYKH